MTPGKELIRIMTASFMLCAAMMMVALASKTESDFLLVGNLVGALGMTSAGVMQIAMLARRISQDVVKGEK